jgi:hypothetical protein
MVSKRKTINERWTSDKEVVNCGKISLSGVRRQQWVG